jgi:hypothetical protein
MQSATHHDMKYLKISIPTSWIECTIKNSNGGHLGGEIPQKTPKGETLAKSSYSNRTGNTELVPVNRLARAATQITWFVKGQSVRGSERPVISFVLKEP